MNGYEEFYTKAYDVFSAIATERESQDAKWGEQNHSPQYWLGILGEEFGELCQAVNETVLPNADKKHLGGYDEMRKEAIQIAAVAVAFVECLDRANSVNRKCKTCKYESTFDSSCIGCSVHKNWTPKKKPTTIDMVCKNCRNHIIQNTNCAHCNNYDKFEAKV